jgi:regulator of protease activity HflC (stomatin/prohibitin superfamily)
MKTENSFIPLNGYTAVIVLSVFVVAIACLFIMGYSLLPGFLIALWVFLFCGLIVVTPNKSVILLLFGEYKGSIKDSGLHWILPFYKRISLSLRANNFESEKIKVNDKLGNPIMISVILVWRVNDTYKALFEVDNCEDFIKIQTDSAVRKLAGSFPYDHFEDEKATVTLTTNFEDVNKTLEQEIMDRLQIAGIMVIEARIAYLAYAPEIAHSMLRRQQASAVVAARHKIVEGAVGMVESALHLLSAKNIIELDEEKKAAMVSNLMVVLCGDKEAGPVINTGTLNH